MRRGLFGLTRSPFPFAFSLVGSLLLVPCSAVEAQQRPSPLKIGYLAVTSRDVEAAARVEAFRKGLSDLGYQEGKSFVIESRYAEGDLERLFSQARDLVDLRVNIIVAADVRAARAVTKASRTIPVVLAGGRDPVEAGVVASFARPGGNVTGLTNVTTELFGKRIDLLKETFPKIVRLSVLVDIATGELEEQRPRLEKWQDLPPGLGSCSSGWRLKALSRTLIKLSENSQKPVTGSYHFASIHTRHASEADRGIGNEGSFADNDCRT